MAMQRLLVAATIGAVSSFRVQINKTEHELMTDMLDEGVPKRGLCSLSTDPHILSFDSSAKGGRRYQATQAAGHWWLVKTESGKIKVQATYGYCGRATCVSGIAVSGSFMGDSTLIIQAPCDWDQATKKCRNADKDPRITWKGAKVQSVNEGGVVVTAKKANHVVAKLPENVEIDATFYHGSPPGFINARIFMVQGSAGTQCGHCGNFDGNGKNDDIYEQTGALKASFQGGCDAFVQCKDRLIPGDASCVETVKEPVKEKCPLDVRNRAEEVCKEKIAAAADPSIADKIPANLKDDELKDCITDACLDQGFEEDDAADDEELNEAIAKIGR